MPSFGGAACSRRNGKALIRPAATRVGAKGSDLLLLPLTASERGEEEAESESGGVAAGARAAELLSASELKEAAGPAVAAGPGVAAVRAHRHFTAPLPTAVATSHQWPPERRASAGGPAGPRAGQGPGITGNKRRLT
jgi:hypothetical protein